MGLFSELLSYSVESVAQLLDGAALSQELAAHFIPLLGQPSLFLHKLRVNRIAVYNRARVETRIYNLRTIVLLKSFKGTDLRCLFYELRRFLMVRRLLELLGAASRILRGFLRLEITACLRIGHLGCDFSLLLCNVFRDKSLSA